MQPQGQNIDISLKNSFFEAQFANITDSLLSQGSLVDAGTLMRIYSLAEAGYFDAQVTLAGLYCGKEVSLDSDPYLTDEDLNPELGLYWAMQASASPKCNDYAALDMARILLQFDRPECRLRALSLLIKAQSSAENTVQDSSADMIRTHFSDFNLEDFVASYKPSAAATPPTPPQKNLF